MEQIFSPMEQKNNSNIELLEIVSSSLQSLDDRFAVKNPENVLVISGMIHIKDIQTIPISFEGEYTSLDELQKSVSSLIKNHDIPLTSFVESISVEGFEKSSLNKELDGTSFYRRLL